MLLLGVVGICWTVVRVLWTVATVGGYECIIGCCAAVYVCLQGYLLNCY